MLNDFYGKPKLVEHEGKKIIILAILTKYKFELKQLFLKMATLNNAAWAMELPSFGVNPYVSIVIPLIEL
jgi:hypothetical protein